MAEKSGWQNIDIQKNIMMAGFVKGSSRINIYYSKPWRLTVATVINHPVGGRKQLFRKFIRMDELPRIFRNPRAHTGKGYYKK